MRNEIREAAAAPGASSPREDFVADLHRRLRVEIDGGPDGDGREDIAAPPRVSRRQLLSVATGALGAVTLGAAGEYAVERSRRQDRSGGSLSPEAGRWTPVAATGDVPAGSAVTFSVANVAGVVANDGGRLAAVSGVCTHQGCLLRLDPARRRLDCPCHSTAFSLSGAVLHHALPQAPRPLPHLAVREQDGQIEVLLPPL